jgi:hypothetical protein
LLNQAAIQQMRLLTEDHAIKKLSGGAVWATPTF